MSLVVVAKWDCSLLWKIKVMWKLLVTNNIKCEYNCDCVSAPNVGHILFECPIVDTIRKDWKNQISKAKIHTSKFPDGNFITLNKRYIIIEKTT